MSRRDQNRKAALYGGKGQGHGSDADVGPALQGQSFITHKGQGHGSDADVGPALHLKDTRMDRLYMSAMSAILHVGEGHAKFHGLRRLRRLSAADSVYTESVKGVAASYGHVMSRRRRR